MLLRPKPATCVVGFSFMKVTLLNDLGLHTIDIAIQSFIIVYFVECAWQSYKKEVAL